MIDSKQISSTLPGIENSQSGWGDWPEEVTILASNRGAVAVLPAGYPLRQSSYIRRKGHLIVQAPHCPEIAIPRFFSGGGQTTLVTGDGVEVSRYIVLLMMTLSSRVEQALNALAGFSGE